LEIHFWYLNTWKKDYFVDFVKKLGWKTELIPDKFDPNIIQKEFEDTKTHSSDKGTKVLDNIQIIENVLCNWMWAKITPKRKDD